MIEIKKMSINSPDARKLIGELNEALEVIVGDDGTSHFENTDVEQERSIFLIGYIDGVPYACGALRELSEQCGEIKRIYARKNKCHMGSAVIGALEDAAKEFGYKKLVLETRVQNTHAISFYGKNGYNHCENFGVYQNNKNSYCFQKEISI